MMSNVVYYRFYRLNNLIKLKVFIMDYNNKNDTLCKQVFNEQTCSSIVNVFTNTRPEIKSLSLSLSLTRYNEYYQEMK